MRKPVVPNPYRLWMTNLGYWAHAHCADMEAAKTEARRLGFDSLIVHRNSDGSDTPLLAYSTIGGFRQMEA